MPIAAATAIALAFVMAVVLLTDLWVYTDAKERTRRGNPVVVSSHSFVLSTPVAWLVGCLLFWEVCFPLYVNTRGPAGY